MISDPELSRLCVPASGARAGEVGGQYGWEHAHKRPNTRTHRCTARQAAWHKWVEHLHATSGFPSSSPATVGSQPIAKLLPQAFRYRFYGSVPLGTSSANAVSATCAMQCRRW